MLTVQQHQVDLLSPPNPPPLIKKLKFNLNSMRNDFFYFPSDFNLELL